MADRPTSESYVLVMEKTSTRDGIIRRIDELLLKLIDHSEESLLITADGESLYVTGSNKGQTFLAENQQIAENFHNFCYGFSLESKKPKIYTRVNFAEVGTHFHSLEKEQPKHAFTVINLQALDSDNEEESEEINTDFSHKKRNDFQVFNIQSQNDSPRNSDSSPSKDVAQRGTSWKGNSNNMRNFKVEISKNNKKAQIKLSPIKGMKEKSGGLMKKDTVKTSKSSSTATHTINDKHQDPHDVEHRDSHDTDHSDSSHLDSIDLSISTIQGKSFNISVEESSSKSPKMLSPNKAKRITIDSNLNNHAHHDKELSEQDLSEAVCQKEDLGTEELKKMGAKDKMCERDKCSHGYPSDTNRCNVEGDETSLGVSGVRENSSQDEDNMKFVSKETDTVENPLNAGKQESIQGTNQKTLSDHSCIISAKHAPKIKKKTSSGGRDTKVGDSLSLNKGVLKETPHADTLQHSLEMPNSEAVEKQAHSTSFNEKSEEKEQNKMDDFQVNKAGSHPGDKQTAKDGIIPKSSCPVKKSYKIPLKKSSADTVSTEVKEKGKTKFHTGPRKRKKTGSPSKSTVKKRKDCQNSTINLSSKEEEESVDAVSTTLSLPVSEATEGLDKSKEDKNLGESTVKEVSKSPSKDTKKSPERKRSEEKVNEDSVTSHKTEQVLQTEQPHQVGKYDEKARKLKKTLVVKLERIPNIQNYGKTIWKSSSPHDTQIQEFKSMPAANSRSPGKQVKEHSSKSLQHNKGEVDTAKSILHCIKHDDIADQALQESFLNTKDVTSKTAALSVKLNSIEDVDQRKTDSLQQHTKDADQPETESLQPSTEGVDKNAAESLQHSTENVDQHSIESLQCCTENIDKPVTESMKASFKKRHKVSKKLEKHGTQNTSEPAAQLKEISQDKKDKSSSKSKTPSKLKMHASENNEECSSNSKRRKLETESNKVSLLKIDGQREESEKHQQGQKANLASSDCSVLESPKLLLTVRKDSKDDPFSAASNSDSGKKENSAKTGGRISISIKVAEKSTNKKPNQSAVMGKGVPDLKNFSLNLKALTSQLALQKKKKP